MNYQSRQKYKVLGRCKPEDVLPHTGPGAVNKTFFNRSIKMTSLRYQTFRKSTRCVCCGIEGTVMLLELPYRENVPHFNLYAEREGKLVQMTKDHKQPKSKGGRDFIGNMQTMCHNCNELKGDRHLRGGNKRILKGLHKIRDGSQIVYMVSGSPSMDDVLEGFATTPSGIARIVEKHLEYPYPGEKFEIIVDIPSGYVIIEEEEDGFKHTYYIHKIERV